MTNQHSLTTRTPKKVLNNMITSIGRFYEKRHQLYGALDQYSKVLSSDPNDTATYIDRSRVFLKMGSIKKAQEDTDVALNLIDEKKQNTTLLFYYVCLQKAEVLYADGEFELALVYFHRANKVKPAQQTCLDGIRKITEILHCTICNSNVQLTITTHLLKTKEKQVNHQVNLLKRLPIRKILPPIEPPLTEYTETQANRLLIEVAKDRQLLINLYKDPQTSTGFTGLKKAKFEARQAIAIIESQLKFLDKAECFHLDENINRERMICTSDKDRTNLIRLAEDELIHLHKLSSKEKSIEEKELILSYGPSIRAILRLIYEVLYRSMKIINCLQLYDNIQNIFDSRLRLILAEAYRLIGQSYNELNLYEQSIENYKQVHNILSPLKDKNCLYRSLYDIAHCLMLDKKYNNSIEIFHTMFDEAITDSQRAFVYQNISQCYLYMNNFEQAKHFIYKTLDYASMSNDELLLIESNIILSRIYYELNDFQRSKECINYAKNLKDKLGNINQMKSLDEFLNKIQNNKNEIFQNNRSKFVSYENEYVKKINQRWTSSTMENEKNANQHQNKITFETIDNRTISNYRILTPYHHLFDMCIERKKKHVRNMDHPKQTTTINSTLSPSVPFITTTNSLSDNV